MLIPLNVLEKLDSISKADSLNALESEIANAIEKLSNTTASDLALGMLHSGIKFCLKVAAAIIIYMGWSALRAKK